MEKWGGGICIIGKIQACKAFFLLPSPLFFSDAITPRILKEFEEEEKT